MGDCAPENKKSVAEKFHDAWLLCLWLDDLFEKLVDIALADAGDDVVVDGDADTFGAMVETESAADGDLIFETIFGDELFQAGQNLIAAALVAGAADTNLYFHFFHTPL